MNKGILLAVSSLNGLYYVGDFDMCAYEFIDYLNQRGYSYWQILPLNPLGPGDSPYMSSCSNAIDIRYVSLSWLKNRGYIKELPKAKNTKHSKFKKALKIKTNYLKIAFESTDLQSNIDYIKFKNENEWVYKYAIFELLKSKYKKKKWNLWDKEDLNYFDYEHKLSYAHQKGIKIIADIPFYVGYNSVDCWLNKDEFLLTNGYKQELEAGVPPDPFSSIGQKWGMPIYNFTKMKENNYFFLINRILDLSKISDFIRLDHFRAFDTYCVIPCKDKNAINGKWEQGPSYAFFDLLYQKKPDINLISEDLGILFPSVYELRDHYHLPGMHVFQFNMYEGHPLSNDNMVVYSGTHDTDTLLGWLKKQDKKSLEMIKKNIGYESGDLFDKCMEYVNSLPSKMTIIPMQDILKLDNKARMNTPNTTGFPNFCWKLSDDSYKNK